MQKTLEDRYFDMLTAIRTNDKELLVESVKNGANPMQLNNRRQNSLHYIAEFGTKDTAFAFMKYLSKRMPNVVIQLYRTGQLIS